MSQEDFQTQYRNFCVSQGFTRQARYTRLHQIVDFLILVTIAGRFAGMHGLRPGQNASQEHIQQASDFFRNWRAIEPTARLLIKHGYHLLMRLPEMTEGSLTGCRMYYEERGSQLPKEMELLRGGSE